MTRPPPMDAGLDRLHAPDRVWEVLSRTPGPISLEDLEARAGLTRAGVLHAIAVLAKADRISVSLSKKGGQHVA